MQKKIVQWYILPHPLTDKESPFVNLFPWGDLDSNDANASKSFRDLVNERLPILDIKLKNFLEARNNNLKNIRIYSGSVNGVDPINHTWSRFPDVEIKYIGKDIPNPLDINVFPLRLHGNHRPLWEDPDKWPLTNLHPIAIKFLRKFPWCAVLLHDITESQNLTSYREGIIYSIALQRKKTKILFNPIFWISGSSTPKESYITPNSIPIPKWLFLGGSHQWLEETVYSSKPEWSPTSEPNLNPPEMRDGVRFLCYAGRWRLNRIILSYDLLKILPKSRIWISVTGVKDLDLSRSDAKYALDTLKEISILDNIPYQYTEEQEQEIIKKYNNLVERLPINTFPKYVRDDYREDYLYAPKINHYKNIFVDIVMETFNERQGVNPKVVFITEKTAKPIRACRPFIISANAGFYKELHKLGFKTFDSWWDESFDEDVDVVTANKRLLNTVEKINSWTSEKCLQVFEEMKPVLLHNYNVLEEIVNTRPRSWLTTARQLHKEWTDTNPKWTLGD